MPRLFYLTTEPEPFVDLWRSENAPMVLHILGCSGRLGRPEWLVWVDWAEGEPLPAPPGSRRITHAEVLSRGQPSALPRDTPEAPDVLFQRLLRNRKY